MGGVHGTAAAAAAAGRADRERAELPAGAGLAVTVRELLHRQLLVAVRRVLRPDAGPVPVAGALPLRRRVRRARPARVRGRRPAPHRVQPAPQRLLCRDRDLGLCSGRWRSGAVVVGDAY
ncbi:hypothetical protein VPH35_076155 [Triticum aestivum]